jgi:hypothetical protein
MRPSVGAPPPRFATHFPRLDRANPFALPTGDLVP